MSESPTHARFPTTHWSRVVAAGDREAPGAGEALAGLCASYWYPVYAFIRRRGHAAEEARDLTQAYFARLLEKGTVSAADPDKGRFRAFLRADCAYFLADRRDHDRAAHRGGSRPTLAIDGADAEARYTREPAHGESAEYLFERAWALALLDAALGDVGRHYAETGRAPLFDRLRPALTAGEDAGPYAEIARDLGLNAGAVQVATHRLRARFGAALRERIAATLDHPTPAEIDDEVRALFTTLGGST